MEDAGIGTASTLQQEEGTLQALDGVVMPQLPSLPHREFKRPNKPPDIERERPVNRERGT